jgi:hypothetical protein
VPMPGIMRICGQTLPQRLVAGCQKAFIKAIDDPTIKELWPQLVRAEEMESLWQSALAEAKAKGPER